MLSPHEFGAGTLSEAQPLSFILPRDKYEQMFIIGELAGRPYAVCLTGQWKYNGFPSADNMAHSGMILPNVKIEMDETSLFKVDGLFPPIGAVVRDGDGLFLGCRAEGMPTQGVPKVTLVSGLTHYSGQVGFTRWAVTVGEGQAKRVLHSIDVAIAGV